MAEPSIWDAFSSCVEQGANRVVVSPFFLSPGRHWNTVAQLTINIDGVLFLIAHSTNGLENTVIEWIRAFYFTGYSVADR